ncbi:MAG TPA: isochorismatase family protein [Phycisphaerae bacterium]|nr:isochorismatase family protein [Phycisphaerae bacterium]
MYTIPGPVILDLNSQRDLLAPDGAYPIFQAEKLFDPLKRLFTLAHRSHIPVVSTRLQNLIAPGQRGNNRLICNPNTPGYEKMPFTLLRRRTEWPLDCGTNLPVEGFRTVQQFVFDLPSLNLFESPRLDRLLSEATFELLLIVGMPVEWTVRTAVLGLLARRHKVAMVSDAIGMWDPYEGDMALRQIESKNIEWLTVDQVAERYGAQNKSRATRLARAKARATQGNVPAKPHSSKTPRGAFRI